MRILLFLLEGFPHKPNKLLEIQPIVVILKLLLDVVDTRIIKRHHDMPHIPFVMRIYCQFLFLSEVFDDRLKTNLTHLQIQTKQYNQMYYSFSLTLVHPLINQLIEAVESQVALNGVAAMAPVTTASQAKHAITTMVFISFAERFSNRGKLIQQRDPLPAKIDSFGTDKIEKQETHQRSAVGNIMGRVEDKSRSIATQRSKQSFRSKKFVIDTISNEGKQLKKSQTSNKESFLISLLDEQQMDGSEQIMRQTERKRVEEQLKTKKKLDQQQREREKNTLASQILLKQKKPFTFDYEGVSQSVNPSKLPGEVVRKLKEELPQGQVLKKQRTTENKQIQNNRQKEDRSKSTFLRENVPVFSQKSFSVVEALGDDSKISEGVKITELRGATNSVTIQHKTKKLDGLKMYRLKDYKNLTKEKSFQEFPIAASRKSSLLELSSSHIDKMTASQIEKPNTRRQRLTPKSSEKSQTFLKSQRQNALDDVLGRGLPFIRTKGLKFYDVGSVRSFKTVDFNFSSSERKSNWRSKIKITDALLFQDILLS